MTQTAPQSARVVKRRALPDIVRDFAQLVEAIPEADDATAALDMAGRVLDAQSPDQLNIVGELPDGREVAGRTLLVLGLQRRRSDKGSRLGWYLDVDAADAETGESVRFQTGAELVVCVLAKASAEGWLPLKVRITEAEETKAGFRPLNVQVFGTGADAF